MWPEARRHAAGRLAWLPRALVLWAIGLYQRHLSPRKGFRCAYAACTGRRSCSQLGWRAVRMRGAWRGLALARQRTRRCGLAWQSLPAAPRRAPRWQRGDCDLGCDLPCDNGCDLPSGKTCGNALQLADCCDCGSCDWGRRKQRRNKA